MSVSKLATAYSMCRGIARREARNFYYSFLVLPSAKRNALCAVYAFMRHADDITDNESIAVFERREQLALWRDRWHQVLAGAPSDDPIFVALADAQKRYCIPPELLDQLMRGTSLDLEVQDAPTTSSQTPSQPGTVAAAAIRTHRTFADLYQYCYLVASVVGLVCIRIYQYEDPRAEQLAERCGVAFQLTNIIRDVKEDAAMARVYLPEEDLAKFGLSVDDFLRDAGAHLQQSRLAALLEFEAQRAREYYTSAAELISMIHDDSRGALWVMVTIYERLLDKIAQNNFDVLHGRVRLSPREKLGILAKGMVKSLLHRL